MDEQLLSALSSIPVSEVPRDIWIRIGMALKEAGTDVSVWDEWSQDDARYSPGECETKWAGFNGNSSPVSAGTIVQIAKEFGRTPVAGIEICNMFSILGRTFAVIHTVYLDCQIIEVIQCANVYSIASAHVVRIPSIHIDSCQKLTAILSNTNFIIQRIQALHPASAISHIRKIHFGIGTAIAYSNFQNYWQ